MTEVKYLQRGTREYHRANLALFSAGFVTFSSLYAFQPLFPNLVAEFAISPTLASLSLSVATFALAWTLPFSGMLSDALGRRVLMGSAVVIASLLALATASEASFHTLLGMRLLQGCVLAGVPAVAMAYLREEIEPRAIGGAMGLYIAGNAFGGMTGRILTAWLADILPWRMAVGGIALLSLLMSALFLLLLPASRNFQRRPLHLGQLAGSLLNHLRNPGLLCLFMISFSCMGGFVTLYNYITFRLLGPEFGLGQSQVAAIFLAYAFGACGSGAMGALTDRFGRSPVLFCCLAIMAAGVLLTCAAELALVVSGIVVFTIGFFGTHTVASAWVGFTANHSRGQAAALYLFFYYLGSSISGTVGGWFYGHWRWTGVSAMVLLLISLAVAAGLRLRGIIKGQDRASADPGRLQAGKAA